MNKNELVLYPASCSIGAPSVRQLPDRTVENPDEVLFLQLSWSHNIVLMQKIQDLPPRLWYARQTLELASSLPSIEAIEAELSQDLAEDES